MKNKVNYWKSNCYIIAFHCCFPPNIGIIFRNEFVSRVDTLCVVCLSASFLFFGVSGAVEAWVGGQQVYADVAFTLPEIKQEEEVKQVLQVQDNCC